MLKVVIPAQTMDFDFNEARTTAFLSVPPTPKRFGDYSLSAPTSPSRMAEFYRSFEEESSGIPFDWEERPGTPKSRAADDDFAFDIGGELDNASLSAEELFDGGKIRPLKPPRLQLEDYNSINLKSPLIQSPRSPRSPKRIIRDVFSPRRKKDYASDPFATAAENDRKRTDNERGRNRVPAGLMSTTSRRAARSVSPLRVSEYPWEEQEEKQQHQEKQSEVNSKSLFSSITSKGSSRKWRLKDFLLFRSASEGHASDKDPYRNYPALFRRPEDVKDSSFRSTDSSGSGSGSGSRRRGHVSAHELHYTANKAASRDLKKKTFLPYKQGILGRLAFNPTR